MRDYYERASELHRVCRAFLLRHVPPARRGVVPLGLLRRRPRGTFEIRDAALYTRGEVAAHGSARRLLEAVAISQREGVDLSEELKLEIRGALRLVDRPFRESREAGRALLRLLALKGRAGAALRAMHETGLLGRLLPEFARVTFLVQHDFYHRYTVDEHTLAAIDALDRLAGPGGDPALDRFREVLDEVRQPLALTLGLLLHDLGKGRGRGHVRRGLRLAERVLSRLQVDAGVAADAAFLVEAHVEMSQLSQRRDLSEPGLAEAFARRVSTLDRLNMLLLLTYADHCGVGPGAWNEWKAGLLWDLYARTRAQLAPGSARTREAEETARERALRQLEGESSPGEVERHFALMPERYLRTTGGAELVRHFRLLQRRGARALVAEWCPAPHGTDLVVAAADHRGLLADLAGTLTAQRLDILSVDVYTREDGVALDLFRVRAAHDKGPVPPERWDAIESALRSAAEGRHDVAAAVEAWRRSARPRPARRPRARPKVSFDHRASATHTVIEVRAEDEPGLAYRIASSLRQGGLDIALAKLATDKSHAFDVFYVTTAAGGTLDAAESARVEAALVAALDPRPTREP
jgi:[protein-PII] uridylyltransferase